MQVLSVKKLKMSTHLLGGWETKIKQESDEITTKKLPKDVVLFVHQPVKSTRYDVTET